MTVRFLTLLASVFLTAQAAQAACNLNFFVADMTLPYLNSAKTPANPLRLEDAYALACTRHPNGRAWYDSSLQNIAQTRAFLRRVYAQNLIEENEYNHYISWFRQVESGVKGCRSTVTNRNRSIPTRPPTFQIVIDRQNNNIIYLEHLNNGRVVSSVMTHRVWVGNALADDGLKLCDGVLRQ